MRGARQTVKRRIFVSNTAMVLVTLSLFLSVNMAVVHVYEGMEEESMLASSELADKAEQIRNILATWDPSPKEGSLRDLAMTLNKFGFSFAVEREGEVIYANADFPVSGLISDIGDNFETDEKVHVYVEDYLTVLTLYVPGEKMKVFAIAGEYRGFKFQNDRLPTLLALLLIDGLFCIAALLVISQIFTRKLIKHITNPLDALVKGAMRMKEGNFSEAVTYAGDVEFEYVRDAFNEMQVHITEANAEREAYERARIELVAGISHDLRTPLTAIRGTLKGLKDGVAKTPEAREKFLDTAYRRTMEMGQLLERLLYFSNLETGSLPMVLEKTELRGFLEAYAKRYLEYTENESARINVTCAKEGLSSNIDRAQMERALDNILENGEKYAGTDTLEIDIAIFEDEDFAILEVSDNGRGVSEDVLPLIFGLFFRGDESRTKKEGNGLGLYIVNYIVNAMGGSVTAENKNGLTIRIKLPKITKGGEIDER